MATSTTNTSLTTLTPAQQGWESFKRSFERRTGDLTRSPAIWFSNHQYTIPVSFVAATCFTALSPFSGLVYGITNAIVKSVIGDAINADCGNLDAQDNTFAKTVKIAVPKILGIAAGCGVVAITGLLAPEAIVVLAAGTLALSVAFPFGIAAIGAVVHGSFAAYDGTQAYLNAPANQSAAGVRA